MFALALEIFGVLAIAATGIAIALLPGFLGFGALLLGLRRGRRRHVTIGAGLGAGAVIVAGAFGGATAAVLGATVCFALAWDAAETALTNGERVGEGAVSSQNEFRHLAATAGVLLVAAGGSFAAYRLTTGVVPVTAVLALLVGGVFVIISVRS